MRIAIDVSPVVYETGVSVYTRNLVKNLLEVDDNDYVLFAGTLRRKKDVEDFYASIKGRCEKKVFPIPPTLADIIWNRLHKVEIEKLVGNIDVFHSSDWTQPPSRAYKVTTIHDLVPFKFPRLTHPRIFEAHKRRLALVKSQADAVIVPSNATKEDVVAMGIEQEKIFVIPEAADPVFGKVNESEIKSLKAKYRISGKYLLAVGTNPRKNTERIIEAFEKISSQFKLKLVIIGLHFNKADGRRGIMFTGHVPASEVPVFYKGAEALVYPSLYEGFGLPILEGFASQTPVVTSNISSMKEVAGNAASLVDPYDVGSIAEGIVLALRRKVGYQKLGLKRLKSYSWRINAIQTANIYKKAVL
jgi:glycosyltransferase involved in cell wall biosynthesis